MIFLSYTWRDRSRAWELDALLRAAGFDVWIDHRDLRPDHGILSQLDSAIRDCEMFVRITPMGIAATPWMRTELRLARWHRRTILVCGTSPSAFAALLRARYIGGACRMRLAADRPERSL